MSRDSGRSNELYLVILERKVILLWCMWMVQWIPLRDPVYPSELSQNKCLGLVILSAIVIYLCARVHISHL